MDVHNSEQVEELKNRLSNFNLKEPQNSGLFAEIIDELFKGCKQATKSRILKYHGLILNGSYYSDLDVSAVFYKIDKITYYPVKTSWAVSKDFTGCIFAVGFVNTVYYNFGRQLYAFHIPPSMYLFWQSIKEKLDFVVICEINPYSVAFNLFSPERSSNSVLAFINCETKEIVLWDRDCTGEIVPLGRPDLTQWKDDYINKANCVMNVYKQEGANNLCCKCNVL